MTDAACCCCGAVAWRASYVFDTYQVFVCTQCGLGCLRGTLPAPEVFYGQEYYASDDPSRGYAAYAQLAAAMRRTMAARLARIERYVPARGRLLDMGCGLGTALEVAAQRGWQAEGMEVAEATVAWLRERGYAAQCGRAEELQAHATFECITMWDTLEHVTDAGAAVHAAARALRPGGVLALTTGDRASVCARLSGRRWHLYNIPEHRFFFTAAALRALFVRNGLQIVELRRRGSWYPLRYLCERLQRKYGLTLPLPAACRAWSVYINLFDIMEVHAVKVEA